MANKTFVEKAAEKVGYGLAMVEDVAGTVATAIGSAADALKNSPVNKEPVEAVNIAAKTTPTKKAAKKSAAKKSPAKKVVAKKGAKKSPAKKAVPKKAAKKLPKKSAKRTAGSRR